MNGNLLRAVDKWLTHLENLRYAFVITVRIYSTKERGMAKAKTEVKQSARQEMHGVERLALRVSSMINHPIAQDQRWVTIHRLDTDGDREWEEVMGVLSETDGIDMTFNDEDESVTLRWEASSEDDPRVEVIDEFLAVEEPAPF
jgi:hypothetical protein